MQFTNFLAIKVLHDVPGSTRGVTNCLMYGKLVILFNQPTVFKEAEIAIPVVLKIEADFGHSFCI